MNSTKAATLDATATAENFWRALYGKEAPGYLAMIQFPNGIAKVKWFAANDLHRAARFAAGRCDLYFGIGLHPTALPAGQRGTAENVSGIPGLWLEIDVLGPAHKANDLPPTAEDAYELIVEFPLSPTLIVWSGHGWHVHWLFRELWRFDGDSERRRAADLAARFQATIRAKAAAHGWRVDSTADLARVLRPPGTVNAKMTKPETVSILEVVDDRRYDPTDFEPYLLDVVEVTPAEPTPNGTVLPWQSFPLGKDALEFIAFGVPIGEQRNRAVAAARNLLSAGRTVDETAAALWRGLSASPNDPDRKPWTFADALAIARDLAEKPPKPLKPLVSPNGLSHAPRLAEARELPTIDATERHLPTITGAAWAALVAANESQRYFRHGSELVRLDQSDAGLAPAELTVDRMRHELARSATWTKPTKDGNGYDPAMPPLDVVRDLLATANPPLPVLLGIVETPVFAETGALQSAPGYDSTTRLYLAPAPNLDVPPVSLDPTPADVDAARRLIVDELLGDFPFVDQSDQANTVGLIVEQFAREAITGPTPLRMVESPGPGTGKGLLVACILAVGVGSRVGLIAQCHDDDEARKRITASLRANARAIWLDNLTAPLVSGTLAAALTATTWTDRLLGKSDNLTLPVRCLWLATANNPTLSTEIARRTIRIRLDPKVDRPWTREGFRHADLRGFVSVNRGRLVAAALTLIRAWLAAGRPAPNVRPLGSFESWTRVIGGLVENAGIQGFLGNAADFYDVADAEGAAWRAFVGEWWATFADAGQTTKTLYPLAEELGIFNLGKGDERARRTAFGMALGKQRDRVFDLSQMDGKSHVYRVTQAGKAHRAIVWQLVPGNLGNLGEPFDTTPTREAEDYLYGGDPKRFTKVRKVHPTPAPWPSCSTCDQPAFCGDTADHTVYYCADHTPPDYARHRPIG